MRIIFIGPPGAGKGTQAQRLARNFLVPHISTGDILRQEINENTLLGQSAQQFMQQGKLVPDEVVLEIVKCRLNQPDCLMGFLLDGFPRSLSQAGDLQGYLDSRRLKLTAAIEIQVKTAELVRRLAARGRADDEPKVIEARIEDFQQQKQPLVSYYQHVRLLRTVDGHGTMEEVFQRLLAVADELLQFNLA